MAAPPLTYVLLWVLVLLALWVSKGTPSTEHRDGRTSQANQPVRKLPRRKEGGGRGGGGGRPRGTRYNRTQKDGDRRCTYNAYTKPTKKPTFFMPLRRVKQHQARIQAGEPERYSFIRRRQRPSPKHCTCMHIYVHSMKHTASSPDIGTLAR